MNPIGSCQIGHPNLTKRWEFKEKHFETLYNQYYRRIYCICRRYSSKPEDAKDLTHDVFVQYFQNFEKFRHEASPSTWMYRVAINLGITRWRKNRTQHLDDKEWESIPVAAQNTENMILDRIALKKILDQCPERTRKVLFLFHFERMTQVEIGKLLGISRATVTRHLVHVRRFHRSQTPSRPGTRASGGSFAVPAK